MQYEGLNRVLEEFGAKVVKDLQDNIDRKGINATGVLRQSIDYSVLTTDNETIFKLGWLSDAADYAFYADKGRKAGKMPPLEPIEKWITAKGIDVNIPTKRKKTSIRKKAKLKHKIKGAKKTRRVTRTGSLAKRRSLSYIIARKIGMNGTKATNFYSEIVTDELFKELRKDLAVALKQDIEIEIKKK